MITKICPKCHTALIPYKANMCEKCHVRYDAERRKRDKQTKPERDRRYNQTRDEKHVQFYNSAAWQRLREYKLGLALHMCEDCKRRAATEVHHIVTIADDWERRFDVTNLKALCFDCHNKAHDRFNRKGDGG